MLEVTGDATRGDEWACVRLVVDGDRIVEADADGLDRVARRPDAARGSRRSRRAVGCGCPRQRDSVPIFRAAADPARIAVAMSGGVDSAVALLRAGPSAVGVTLRLWIDPKAPDSERACCSPEAVIAARETCHSLGIPHVTLDAREAFRRAIVQPFVEGYARGETPNPCTRCNGSFRFAQLLEFARRAGAARLATGHYARIVEHRGRLLLARAADERKDQSYMLARLDPRASSGSGSRSATRRRTRPARRRSAQACRSRSGPRARRRASWAAATTASSSSGTACRPRGSRRRRGGATVGVHQGFWRFTPGQRRGLGVSAGRPALRDSQRSEDEHVVVGPLESLARRSVTATGHLFASVTRGDAKLRYRSPALPADVEATADGFRLCFDEPAYGVASARRPSSTRTTWSSAPARSLGALRDAASTRAQPRCHYREDDRHPDD